MTPATIVENLKEILTWLTDANEAELVDEIGMVTVGGAVIKPPSPGETNLIIHYAASIAALESQP